MPPLYLRSTQGLNLHDALILNARGSSRHGHEELYGIAVVISERDTRHGRFSLLVTHGLFAPHNGSVHARGGIGERVERGLDKRDTQVVADITRHERTFAVFAEIVELPVFHDLRPLARGNGTVNLIL